MLLIHNEVIRSIDSFQYVVWLDIEKLSSYSIIYLLHVMASKERERLMRMLLNWRDTNVNFRNYYENTSLHLTTQVWHERVIALLKQKNIKINLRNNDERKILNWMSKMRRLLILLSEKEKVNVNIKNIDDRTFLHITTRAENEALIKLLLKYNANANIKDINEFTPLHLAAAIKYEGLMRLLLKHNEDINIQNNDENTFFHMTAFESNERIIKLSLKQRANSNVIDNYENISLHWTNDLRLEIETRFLLKHKIDVNIRNDVDYTSLDVAIQEGHEAIMKLLNIIKRKKKKKKRKESWYFKMARSENDEKTKNDWQKETSIASIHLQCWTRRHEARMLLV